MQGVKKSQKIHQPKVKGGFIKEMKSHYLLYLMFLPGIIFLILFNYLPMFGIVIAFKDINYVDGILRSPWCGLDNFKFFIRTPGIFKMILNTIGYNVVFITLGLVLQVGFAIMLNELRQKFMAKVYQTIMFLPYFLSWVVVGFIVMSFLNPSMGFVNKSILEPLGIAPVSWYTSPKYWPFILTFLSMWKGVGYGTIVYLAAITGIDQELYEAAAIDGATRRQQIIKITLPSLIPIMTILTIMAIGGILNSDFGLFYNATMNQSVLKSATNVLDMYIYNTFILLQDAGISSAAGLIKSVVGVILVLSTNAVVKKINPDNALV